MEALKTKRYTWTRLQRACTHILTNTTKEEIRSANIEQHAPYIRLLGMSQKDKLTFKNKKKSNFQSLLIQNIRPCRFRYREKANSVYFSIMHEPLRTQLLKQDITHHPVRYDETTTNFKKPLYFREVFPYPSFLNMLTHHPAYLLVQFSFLF